MLKDETTKVRPTSPHLEIYRWPITMLGSIAHRSTGIILSFGTLFIVIWFVLLAYFPNAFQSYDHLAHNIIIQILLFIYSFVFVLHSIGGLRHLLWDLFPCLLEKHTASNMTKISFIVSAVITILIWLFAYFIR